MRDGELVRAADRRTRSPDGVATGITVYGCGVDEAALVLEAADRLGVELTLVEDAVTEGNVELAFGNRCVSVGHKSLIGRAALLGLGLVGVEYISARSVGLNHIDVGFAESIGISVENVAYSPDSVADYSVMLILMAVRHAKAVVRRADVHDYRLPDVRGRELRDLTVGVVGTGRIGAAVVGRLLGFGCRVVAFDRQARVAVDYVSLDELLRVSDVVTLHAPLSSETHHLLDRRRVELMKPGAFLVNTGRGGLVDTEALVWAMESGRLGGVALDVLEGEEGVFYADCRGKRIESELLVRLQAMPNALISPHAAYYTDHALSDIVENSLVNCLNFEGGKRRG